MLKEFKEFAMRGSVLDLAIAVIIGAAFGAVVKSLVDNILMPPLGMLLGKMDFSQLVIPLGPDVAIRWGQFVNDIITFLLIAFAVFLVVRLVNRMRRQPQPATPTTKTCPYCIATVPLAATRCPQCTSELNAGA